MSNVPSDIVVTCGALPPAPPNVLATDNCDPNIIVIFNELSLNSSPDCTDDYVISRTWTATDDCGNSVSAEQIITVEGDSEIPVLVGVPTDLTFECSSVPELVDPVTATDNCDVNVELIYNEVIGATDCPQSYTVERTWTAIDDCGNSSSGTQLLTIEDTSSPILINVPSDLNITCGELPPPAPIIMATDNCDPNVIVTFLETSTLPNADCTADYTITRTWLATDACGNSTRAEQIIEITGDSE